MKEYVNLTLNEYYKRLGLKGSRDSYFDSVEIKVRKAEMEEAEKRVAKYRIRFFIKIILIVFLAVIFTFLIMQLLK